MVLELAIRTSKLHPLRTYSQPTEVQRKADRYFGHHVPVFVSERPTKKYQLQRPDGGWVHFGEMGYEDFTKHKDVERRRNYLRRSAHIEGAWKHNRYSPNQLTRRLLW